NRGAGHGDRSWGYNESSAVIVDRPWPLATGVTSMRNTPAWLRVVLMGAGLMVGGVLAGCQPPKGQSSGRIGISDTAEPEYRRSAVLPVVLVEFSDQFPQRLVQDLDDVPQLRDTPG